MSYSRRLPFDSYQLSGNNNLHITMINIRNVAVCQIEINVEMGAFLCLYC